MSLTVILLDFLAGVSDYLQRSTLSSLRARSATGLISSPSGALSFNDQGRPPVHGGREAWIALSARTWQDLPDVRFRSKPAEAS